MRNLFLCNTNYQVIVAACIQSKLYHEEKADIILSDHTVGSDIICSSINACKLIFDKGYYVKSKYLYDNDKNLSAWQRIEMMRDSKTLSAMIPTDEIYDMFFCANAEPYSMRLVNYLKRKNKKIKICWFEDGLSAYDFDQRYFYRTIKGKIKQKLKQIFGAYEVTGVVNEFYVFAPDKMEWLPKAAVKKIPAIDEELAKNLGKIYSYKECRDIYDKKYIFFEDGYGDWGRGSDTLIVEQIARIVGKDNIMVKIHPRNPENRFKNLGYKTNQDTFIPWEIIAMNIDIENKILVTMYSQSVLTPQILLGKACNAIILCKLEKDFETSDQKLFSYMEKHYFLKDKKHYKVPKTHDELIEILKNELEKDCGSYSKGVSVKG